MSKAKLKAAILIISDTAYQDPSTDKAADILKDVLSSDGGDQWSDPISTIIPDDVLDIQRVVQQWTAGENYLNLIITTGGTGFAIKDFTPEVSK